MRLDINCPSNCLSVEEVETVDEISSNIIFKIWTELRKSGNSVTAQNK